MQAAETELPEGPGPEEIMAWLNSRFADLAWVSAEGNQFCFVAQERRMPFLTLVKDDPSETIAGLSRPGVFRLNLGLGRESFEARFGPRPGGTIADGPAETGFDYARLDLLMPHPTYGRMYWVGILNPSRQSFTALAPLLDEAHALAVRKQARAAKVQG